MMTDEVVSNLIAGSIKEVHNIRSLAQVFLSVMEVRGITDLREFIGEEMARPEILQALEIAKANLMHQGTQTIILRSPEQRKEGPLARRMKIGKA